MAYERVNVPANPEAIEKEAADLCNMVYEYEKEMLKEIHLLKDDERYVQDNRHVPSIWELKG